MAEFFLFASSTTELKAEYISLLDFVRLYFSLREHFYTYSNCLGQRPHDVRFPPFMISHLPSHMSHSPPYLQYETIHLRDPQPESKRSQICPWRTCQCAERCAERVDEGWCCADLIQFRLVVMVF